MTISHDFLDFFSSKCRELYLDIYLHNYKYSEYLPRRLNRCLALKWWWNIARSWSPCGWTFC